MSYYNQQVGFPSEQIYYGGQQMGVQSQGNNQEQSEWVMVQYFLTQNHVEQIDIPDHSYDRITATPLLVTRNMSTQLQ